MLWSYKIGSLPWNIFYNIVNQLLIFRGKNIKDAIPGIKNPCKHLIIIKFFYQHKSCERGQGDDDGRADPEEGHDRVQVGGFLQGADLIGANRVHL